MQLFIYNGFVSQIEDILWYFPEGVTNVETSVEKQQVVVESNLSSDELLETLKKTGKPVSYVGTK